MSRRLGLVIGAVLVAVCAFVPTAEASSGTDDSASPVGGVRASESVVPQDLDVEAQQKMEQFLNTWSTRAGDALAGVWIDNDGPRRVAVVQLVAGSRVSGLAAAAESAAFPVLVTEAPTSQAAALEKLTDVADVLEGNPDVDGVYLDVRRQQVVVSSRRPVSLPGSSERDSIAVVNRVESEPMSDTYRGGVNMSSCTVAFAVGNSQPSKGVLTAGHCGSSQSYSTSPTSSASYSAPYRLESRTASTDYQWHTTSSHTPTNTFFGPSAAVTVTRVGTGNGVQGSYLCHRGKTTGYSCGYVQTTTYRPTWAGACPSTCNANWVYVAGGNLRNAAGDSGGPWFSTSGSSGYAYGVHKGGASTTGVYMPIGRISGLGLSLL